MNINQKSKFNLILQKFQEKYSYACEFRKDIPRNVIFVELSGIYFPVIWFSIYWVKIYKTSIYKLAEEKLILNINIEYKLIGMIASHLINHYLTKSVKLLIQILFQLIYTTITEVKNEEKL